ncbi:MAG: hypothetical protein EBX35_12250 [Planctomycetia bacterium]|jgi:hypothetical protein|nr:hypothetical protein [Planctomycetia bacterium]
MTMHQGRRGQAAGGSMRPLPGAALLGLLVTTLATSAGNARADEGQTALPLAPPGMAFRFEVIESHDADYLGDTPAHLGKNGGLTVRPQVALGDPVYRKAVTGRIRVGHVTRVTWSRVAGSLELEFDPEPFQRIAVGDEVWIDLNPAPADVDPSGGRER